jgi:hypothetical protein
LEAKIIGKAEQRAGTAGAVSSGVGVNIAVVEAVASSSRRRGEGAEGILVTKSGRDLLGAAARVTRPRVRRRHGRRTTQKTPINNGCVRLTAQACLLVAGVPVKQRGWAVRVNCNGLDESTQLFFFSESVPPLRKATPQATACAIVASESRRKIEDSANALRVLNVPRNVDVVPKVQTGSLVR